MNLTDEQIERIINSFERAASALESISQAAAGVHGSIYRAVNKFAPDPRPYREAIFSRVPTEEDKAKEAQGASTKPIQEWITESPEEEAEEVGPREREFLEKQRLAKASEGGQSRRGIGPVGNRPG